jgi:hypothetical protein
MTAYTIQSGTYDGIYQKRALDGTQISRVIDWSKLANGTTAVVATDTVDIIDIPAGFVVTNVQSKVISACTTASYYAISPYLTTQTASNAAGTYVASTASTTPTIYQAATAVKITTASPSPHNGQTVVTICGYQMPTV